MAASGLTLVLWFLTYLVPAEWRQHSLPPAIIFFWVALILMGSVAFLRRENSRLRERLRALQNDRKSSKDSAANENVPDVG